VLAVAEKSVTITNKETIYSWSENGALQSREADKVWTLELDENLKKTAKALHGKEVVMTGKVLVLGVASRAESAKTAPPVRPLEPAKGREIPIMPTKVIATSVVSQLVLDDSVTVISLKAAK
jgi:hypothetical protein